MKISIIGAGNVGSALAERILEHDLADVVLLDIVEAIAKAKAFDISDASPFRGYKKRILGTKSYGDIRDSKAVVITAGFPRRTDMSREELVDKNAEIIKAVLKNVREFSPRAVIVMVTNPLDIMTYLAYKETGTDRRKILGMAGNLDAARFKMFLSEELGVSHERIETFVLGSHSETMVPLVSKTLVSGKSLEDILSRKKIEGLIEKTKKRGAQIVQLLKFGSAYFSPSAACLEILKAIIDDEKRVIVCSSVLKGEYGVEDCALGVPAKIGKDGVEEIVEWDLPDDELNALKNSAEAIKEILTHGRSK